MMGARSMRQSVPLSEAQLAMSAQYQQQVQSRAYLQAAMNFPDLMGSQMMNASPQVIRQYAGTLNTVPQPAPGDDRLERAVETIEKLTDALAKATGVEADA